MDFTKEIGMKKGANLSDKEVDQLIVRMRDKELKSWQDIAKALKDMGFVSRRSKSPITFNTVRYRYIYATKAEDSAAQVTRFDNESEAQRTLDLSERFRSLSAPDSEKIQLIKSVMKHI